MINDDQIHFRLPYNKHSGFRGWLGDVKKIIENLHGKKNLWETKWTLWD